VSARAAFLLNYLAYQAGWCAAILGAAYGLGTPGAVAALALTAGHVWLARDRAGELALVVAAAATGVIVESWQIGSGTYRILAGAPADGAAPPLWLLALWAQFATTFRFSLAGVMRRPLRAMLFGAIGGPVAFLAGERLGAVVLQAPLLPGVSRLVVAWALALLWLSWLTRRAARRGEAAYRPVALARSSVPT
jgi:Protein of unknown function (DUF2878)